MLDYKNLVFKNFDINNFVGKNVFIVGGTGTGKSCLMHKIIEILDESYNIVVFDPKYVEFQKESKSNVVKRITDIEEFRIFLNSKDIQDEKTLIIIDDISCLVTKDIRDLLEKMNNSKSSKINYIVCSQLKDAYYRNRKLLEKFDSYELEWDDYKNDSRIIHPLVIKSI